MATFDQSASISSATMRGSEVMEPWPISAPALRMVILPSGAMRTQGVTGALAKALACACGMRRTPSFPSAMQKLMPPRAASMLRREMLVSIIMTLALPRCALDGGDDAVVGPASTNIAVHMRDDVGASGLGILGEELCRLHDLAGLAVAALRHLFRDPGFLQRMRRIRRQAFDGHGFLAGDRAHIDLAGTLRRPVDVDCAGAAETGTAAVFGTRQ